MPRNIDLNNLPPLEEIKAGPIKDLLKPALLSIAGALEIEIPTKISVPELKKQISEALNTPKFSSDTRFEKFTSYRSGTAGRVSKSAPKTSADKAKEDLDAAAHKPDGALSGQVIFGAHNSI